jgi:putative ABC transport system ATP-binding protein
VTPPSALLEPHLTPRPVPHAVVPAAPAGPPLIRIRGLTKLYRMGDSIVHALDGVDLDVHSGEFVAITGASGSGKSTMMHLLGCLDRPTGGSYTLNGRDVSNLNDSQLADIRNREIGFVFQTFNLINRTSAVENVAVPLFYARQTNTRAPARKALARVGLDARGGHKPNELSGGERQRVAIARAIVNNPTFLLADEPTGNLDSRTGEQIMQIFHDLNAQGVTIIIVTHEPDVALQARRIVNMKDGKIVSDRLTADLLREQAGPTAYGISQGAPLRAIQALTAHDTALPRGTLPEAAPPAAPAPFDSAALIARMAPGATATLACGIIAITCAVLSVVLGLYLKGRMPAAPPPGYIPPAPVIAIGLVTMVALLAAIVVGLVAFFFGRGVKRRIRTEPGHWLGAGRARWGGWLGLIAVFIPFVPNIVVLVAKLL